MSQPKKIYVLTSGNYSSYRILGVFSSRYKARKTSDAILEGDDRIETYILDELHNNALVYRVWLSTHSGDVLLIKVDLYSIFNPKILGEAPVITERESVFFTECAAKSRRHAIKIASERLAQWKAQNKET